MTDNVQLKTLEDLNESGKPLGDWTGKPAVPATTVPVTNNSGYDMWVEVTGTTTAVKVDGVTIGSRLSGYFRVRNGSTIALTYSSTTPTWQWFYE